MGIPAKSPRCHIQLRVSGPKDVEPRMRPRTPVSALDPHSAHADPGTNRYGDDVTNRYGSPVLRENSRRADSGGHFKGRTAGASHPRESSRDQKEPRRS